MADEQRTIREASNSSSKVPYHKLFSFADGADHALMVIGAITAVGSGLCLPLMTLIFGELADTFAHNAETKRVAEEVAKVLLHITACMSHIIYAMPKTIIIVVSILLLAVPQVRVSCVGVWHCNIFA